MIHLATLIVLLAALSARAEVASFYGEEHRGKLQANGKPFNPDALTCACWGYPFGTRLRVSYRGRQVIAVVSDRGPSRRLHRDLDLSKAAFAQLAPLKLGLIKVAVEVLP